MIAEASQALAFDWTVNLGQVAIVGSFLFGLGGWAATQRASLLRLGDKTHASMESLGTKIEAAVANQDRLEAAMNGRFERVDAKLENQHEILVKIAQQEVRLNGQERRIDNFDKQVAGLVDEIAELRRSTVFLPPRVIEGTRT